MRGDPKVLAELNVALKGELTAINQYVLHSRMLNHWGFEKLGKREMDESMEEMGHADKLIQRILLLDGLPNLQDLGKLYVGQNIKEVIECDLRLEREGIEHYRKAIRVCEEAGDFVSRDLLIHILQAEEGHEDMLETDLELLEKIGIQNFSQSQM